MFIPTNLVRPGQNVIAFGQCRVIKEVKDWPHRSPGKWMRIIFEDGEVRVVPAHYALTLAYWNGEADVTVKTRDGKITTILNVTPAYVYQLLVDSGHSTLIVEVKEPRTPSEAIAADCARWGCE